MIRKDQQANLKQKIKIVFLGDKGVGKSSIINRFTQNKFQENCPATIGVDFLTKLCKYNKTKYKLQLWDTAGQEKYRSLIKGYLRGANACVFVYDQSNPKTYLNLIEWIKTFQEVSKDQKTIVIIFGNKTDLVQPQNQVQKFKKEAHKLYPKMKDIIQMEGSAKVGDKIQLIFEEILQSFQEYSSQIKFSSQKSIGYSLIKTFNKNKKAKYIECYNYIYDTLAIQLLKVHDLKSKQAQALLKFYNGKGYIYEETFE